MRLRAGESAENLLEQDDTEEVDQRQHGGEDRVDQGAAVGRCYGWLELRRGGVTTRAQQLTGAPAVVRWCGAVGVPFARYGIVAYVAGVLEG